MNTRLPPNPWKFYGEMNLLAETDYSIRAEGKKKQSWKQDLVWSSADILPSGLTFCVKKQKRPFTIPENF